MNSLKQLQKEILKARDPKRAEFLKHFFKTGKGEYAEGDIFYGLTVPESRVLVKKYKDLSVSEIQILLNSKIHEERLIALLLLVHRFQKGDSKIKKEIVGYYLSSTLHINNWDLVDLSADKIIGEYFLSECELGKKSHYEKFLKKFIRSKNLWERRIAVLSTFPFIKSGDSSTITYVGQALLDEKHDLIHKAVGWMLREMGKRDLKPLITFLNTHATTMPRTMLRYAIEKLPEQKRQYYLAKK